MKRNDYYIGGAQRGTRVRWAKDRRSGAGTVVEVHERKWRDIQEGRANYDDKEWTVKDDASGDLIRCNMNQMRFLNTPNRIKKQEYATKNDL